MAFFLRTFGSLQLVDHLQNPILFPEKGLLVLAYLLANKHQPSLRTTLAQLFWGSDDTASALANLRQAISRMKVRQAELGIHLISASKTMVSLGSSPLHSDLILEEKHNALEPFERLRYVLALLKQPFLAHVRCRGVDYDRWLGERREQNLSLLRVLLRKVAPMAQTVDERETVKNAAIFLFSQEPQQAETLQLVIQILGAEGEVDRLRAHLDQRKRTVSQGKRILAAATGEQRRAPIVITDPDNQSATELEPSNDVFPHPISIPRLVLLPPTNQSGNIEAGAIASSLIEDITIGFCAFNSLQVMAPYSAVRIGIDLEEQSTFFENHSVNYVLDTRVSSVRGQVTLFVQLLYWDNRIVLWAERFKLEKLNLALDRKTIVQYIGQTISHEIERHGETLSYLELNKAAYHRYLVGKQHLNQLTLQNVRRARTEMKAALRTSSDFAPALSTMARTYSKEWLLTTQGDITLLKLAETFAARAMSVRPEAPDGYREFGVAKLLQGALDESEEAMALAESLSPHYADVVADHADILVHCCKPELALQKIERATELNPLCPDYYLWIAAGANYALRRFEKTLNDIGRMSDPALADRLSAASWAMLGEPAKARIYVQRTRKENPAFDAQKWLAVLPLKEQWLKELYSEGLKRAGF